MSNQEVSTRVNIANSWRGAQETAGLPTGKPLSVLEAQALRDGSGGVAALRASSATGGLVAALQVFAAPRLLPPPPPVVPYEITGTAYYCNPNVAGTGTGTFADPFKYPQDAANACVAAGDGVLQLFGTTGELFDALAFASSGTLANPRVYGLYIDNGGAPVRVTGIVGGAILDCRSLVVCGPLLTNRDFICFDGLEVIRNTNALFGAITISGTSANNQVLNCRVASPAGIGILDGSTGAGNIIQGNQVSGATVGIFRDIQNANDTNTRIHYNQVRNCVSGIRADDGTLNRTFSGSVQCNTVVNASGDLGSISIQAAGGAFTVSHNFCQSGANGVAWVGSQAGKGNFAGSRIQSNVFRNCEFGMAARKTRGQVQVIFNQAYDSGISIAGLPISASAYGRAYELFGETAANGCSDVLLEFNYAYRAICWPSNIGGPGSEGCGYGLDNNSFNCIVRCNIAEDCEGAGIQSNSGFNNIVEGNLLVNNCSPAPARFDPRVPAHNRGSLAFVLTPYIQIINNTVVSKGGALQDYGVVENQQFPSVGARVQNNLIISANIAALAINSPQTAESGNKAVQAPTLLQQAGGGWLASGVSTAAVPEAAVDLDSPFYRPVPGGACDRGGVAQIGALLSLSGAVFTDPPPVGCLNA